MIYCVYINCRFHTFSIKDNIIINMKSIKEYILDVIQESYIFEMAYDRKEIKKRVEVLINQIIENWCLVN